MCGIAGYIGPRRLDRQRIEACVALMRRRGPDAVGEFSSPAPGGRNVHLLHTRLAIIDLDPRADQPFRAGRQVLSYNGELYNYIEVRARLERQGARFATSSDTEVLARAIETDVAKGLDQCEGMWAFARYDEDDGSLALARDRFGEKPLFLHRGDDGGLWFGSEPKFIFALLGRHLPIDDDHLRRYLVNGYKALYKQDRTFFRGLQELPPASVLSVDSEGTETFARYWDPAVDVVHNLEREEAVLLTRNALIDSVRLRLRADVPLAFCMSGGVDSNSLVAIAKRELGFDVHGFTIVNTDERYEEWPLVEEVVRELRLRHTAVPLTTEGFLPKLRELVRYHDAPVYTITYYVHWLLMAEIAAEGYRISVSGTAADELFTGYFDHHLAYLAHVREDPVRHRQAVLEWEEHVKPAVRNPFLSDPDLFVRDPNFRDHIYLGAEGFAEALHEPWAEPFFERRYSGDLLRNRMQNELHHEAVPVILHEDDRNAMYWSVENRSPFLDRRLYEVAGSIPTRHLIHRGYGKSVLRDAMRGIVPDVVLDEHRKIGFNAPIFDLLDVSDRSVRADLLADSPVFDLVRKDRIEALLARETLANSESKFLFSFVNAKLFLEEMAP